MGHIYMYQQQKKAVKVCLSIYFVVLLMFNMKTRLVMYKSIITYIIYVLLFLSIPCVAQISEKENLIRLTNNDGLSSSSVNSLYQDSRGLLWIGTWDGLNCYDGANVRVFRPDFAARSVLSNPVVRRIFEDEEGMMWIATDYGINRYNVYDGTFDNYYLAYKDKLIFRENAFDVCRNSSNEIIATAYNSGIYHFVEAENGFVKFALPSELPDVGVSQIFFDRNDRLWIVYDKHMACCRVIQEADSVSLAIADVVHFATEQRMVVYDKCNRIWIQGRDGSLSYVEINAPSEVKMAERVAAQVNDVLYNDGKYYFGTNDGLYIYGNSRPAEHRFDGMSILSLAVSTQGILWIGTDARGLYGMIPQEKFFESYTPATLPGLGMYAVRAFLADGDHGLWIGTKGGGLLHVSRQASGRWGDARSYTTREGLPDNSVFAICSASGGDFWVGCDGRGLSYYSHRDRMLHRPEYVGTGSAPDIYSVYALSQRGDSVLWVGTSGNGLFKLYIERVEDKYRILSYKHYSFDKQENCLSSNIIYSLAWQSDTALWIATRGGGLNLLHPEDGRVEVFKNDPNDKYSLSCNDVICVFVDSRGFLWAGTTNGLNRLAYNADKSAFFRMGMGNGLPNNYIHGILEDNNGELWVSTNRGIARINVEKRSTAYYYDKDGLQGNEFSDGASLATGNGTELYFGGSNGFTAFRPREIAISAYKPALYLAAYNVNNEPRPLQPSYDEPVKLNYTENSLDFHFSIIDFVSNSKCLLSYRLLRDNNKAVSRVSIGDTREIILSNLVPGSYELEVSYTNADNTLYEAAFTFPFVITPPWWASAYAYVVYVVVILLIIGVIFWMQRHKIMLKHSREIAAMERAKEEEIHEAKLRFFTNIAHEFSNCITLIYGPCERMMRDVALSDVSCNYLKTIRRNAERMQRLIQQLMEFRKAETGHLALCFEETDVAEIVKYTLDYFTEIADNKKMNVRFEVTATPTMWVVDRDAMEKIVFNLLSNAFKYAPDEGVVALRLVTEGDALYFSCMNTGSTIRPDDQKAIFNRFKVLDNFETKLSQGIFTRNGIGLAMCKDLAALMNGSISVESNDKGETTFTVVIGRNKPTESALPAAAASMPIAYASNPTGLSVLVVDDQPEIRSFIAEILSPKYTVVEAADGAEALQVLQSRMLDIVICDVVMPVMDGFAFLKAVKSDDKTKHIPVILLTSRSAVESYIEGLEDGADMYISKPFHPAYLMAAVDRVLGNKDVMKEYMQSPMAYTEQYKGRIIDRLDKEFIDKLMGVLQQNIANEEFSLEMLANELAVSRVQLYRKIKQLTQQTPSEFIRNYRLQEAEKLLRTTSYTVSEIMVKCGFQNKSYFYREFAKIYDATPKEYRKRQVGEE